MTDKNATPDKAVTHDKKVSPRMTATAAEKIKVSGSRHQLAAALLEFETKDDNLKLSVTQLAARLKMNIGNCCGKVSAKTMTKLIATARNILFVWIENGYYD